MRAGREGKVAMMAQLAIGLLLVVGTVPSASGEVTAWNTAASYPLSVDDESCAVAGRFIYCVGGFIGDTYTTNGSQSTSAVYYTVPSPLGGIPWWASTAAYPTSVNTESCVTAGDYIYCLGGYTSSGITDAAYYGILSPAGGVVQWNGTTSYPTGVFSQSCVAWLGFIYCVGGYESSGLPTNSVYYAPLTPSGIGQWTATTYYPSNVTSQSCLPSGGFIYCVGGITDSKPPVTNAVFYAALSSGGVSQWVNTTSYPTSIDIQSCVIVSEIIHCMGGGPSFAATDAVYHASISPSGGVSAWNKEASYPRVIAEQRCVSSDGFIYCIGGASSASDHTSSVYFAGTDSLVASASTTTSTTTLTVTKTLASTTTETATVTSPASSLSVPASYLVVVLVCVSVLLAIGCLASGQRRSDGGQRLRQVAKRLDGDAYQGRSTGTGCSSPSTGMLRPLIQFARGDPTNTITSATSSGLPSRPIGKPSLTYAAKASPCFIL